MDEESLGPTVGIVIVLALLIAGAIYFFITQQQKLHQNPNQQQVNS